MLEPDLWGVTKIDKAIERLRMFEPPEGYYLAFSGGLDSQTVYRLAEMAGVKFTAHYNVTPDPPELLRFIREQYPAVIWERPRRSMWQIIAQEGLPTRRMRFCCKYLKEIGGAGTVITGIRHEEGSARARRQMVEVCQHDPSKHYLHPIIDWTRAEEWAFLDSQGIPHCSLYDEGFKRLGCILCPMKDRRDRLPDAARWPRYVELYERAAQKRIERLRAQGRATTWQDGAAAIRWWLSEPVAQEPAEQCSFLGIMEGA